MKKTIRLMALVAMAAGLAFASCEDDINNPGGGDTPGGGGGTETAEWVDLGLPSGLLWAKCNLGAAKPEDYGDYYAWGETTTKEVYNWSTYKYCNGGYFAHLTKYCDVSSFGYNGYTDNLTTLLAEDDAATAKLGNGARMPTVDEWDELFDNTTAEWMTMNGVTGRKLTASNGKSLFLPAAGYRWETELRLARNYVYYWSSSLPVGNPIFACYYNDYLSRNYDMELQYGGRAAGLPVRAVRSAR